MNSNQPAKIQNKAQQNRTIAAHLEESFSGPLPHPEILQGFGQINSSFPDRIVTMAENHAKTDDEAKMLAIRANAISMILGQVFSFVFGAGAIGACIYLSLKGNTSAAIVSGIAGITQAVIAGIISFRK